MLYSTDDIWRGSQEDRCLSDDLNAIEGDIEALENGKAPSGHTHTPASIGAAAANHGHSYNDLSDKPTIPTIPSSLPANGGNADTLDGKHASDFAAAGHNHDAAYIKKALQFLNDQGGVTHSYGENSGKNLLTEISQWEQGMHTAYSISGTPGNPSERSCRIIAHMTSVGFGWVLAFDSDGSVYENYQNGVGVFRGWKTLHEASPVALWSGYKLMNSDHTITPSKPLSDCEHGWMLEWSDYDADDSTANNYNIVHTPIFKKNNAGNWSGQGMMFAVPSYITNTGTNPTVAIKQLFVHNTKLVGHQANSQGSTNLDVVLRAVYEF